MSAYESLLYSLPLAAQKKRIQHCRASANIRSNYNLQSRESHNFTSGIIAHSPVKYQLDIIQEQE